MKAVVLHEYGGPDKLKYEEWDDPQAAASMLSLAEDIANGKFKIPVDRMIPLAEAAKAHAEAEKGGIGKVLLLA
jgi:NADPH:quinone reductase-like Zn-dependent oxidoreductase